MPNHLESLGKQESPVKVDLLHLDPTAPDGGCCCGNNHEGHHCCGRHRCHDGAVPSAEKGGGPQ